jgi:hypothetical protein
MSTSDKKTIAERFPIPDVGELSEALKANREEYRQLRGLMKLAAESERLNRTPDDESESAAKPARKASKASKAKADRAETPDEPAAE